MTRGMSSENESLRSGPAEDWDLWPDGERSPAMNMAVDEALLCSTAERGRPLVRFYGWDRMAVSIGYLQDYDAAPEGYAVVRRPTGGGVVYHDHDFTYTVIIPKTHWLAEAKPVASYGYVNRAVAEGLRLGLSSEAQLSAASIGEHVDRRSMVCFENPTRYDIMLGGDKVAGSAQRRRPEGILHQGSIHFGGDLPLGRDELADAVAAGFQKALAIRFVPFRPVPALLAAADE